MYQQYNPSLPSLQRREEGQIAAAGGKQTAASFNRDGYQNGDTTRNHESQQKVARPDDQHAWYRHRSRQIAEMPTFRFDG